MSPRELDRQLAAAARAMQAEPDTRLTSQKCVAIAVDLVEGCDHAGMSVVHRGGPIVTPASTSPVAQRGDELQAALQEGPYLDVLWEHETVLSRNLAAEPRWPRWGTLMVEELGVVSLLCFQLYLTPDLLGVLALTSARPDAFDDHARHAGALLAAHSGVALAQSQRADHLHTAATSRLVIGQAEGILMERFSLTADQAFAVLRRVSQHRNMKLAAVAGELVATRRLPETEVR